MRTSFPLIFESYEKEKKEKKVKEENGKEELNNPNKVIPQAPAMNSDKETENLLKIYKKIELNGMKMIIMHFCLI